MAVVFHSGFESGDMTDWSTLPKISRFNRIRNRWIMWRSVRKQIKEAKAAGQIIWRLKRGRWYRVDNLQKDSVCPHINTVFIF